ncbi:MAG: ribosome recycling factor [Candidatus Latescibacteria bacterium]|nr:ribosome recycling factor [Candidatus Latescibacterota bacterium]
MDEKIVSAVKEKMQKALQSLGQQMASVRTGKANISLLDKIRVDCYGSLLPLNQVASIGAPEVSLITIQPWDKEMLPKIEKSIQASDLGLTPSNDGSIIRLQIPSLTEERRKELARVVKRLAEDSRVEIRNIRREANDTLKKQEKSAELSEDDSHRLMEKVQDLTDEFIEEIDDLLKKKEEEIMTV